MVSPLRHLRTIALCLLAFASLAPITYAQNVTTWHNDNNRTGWQQNETVLTPTSVSQPNNFGLLWQWPVAGRVYAQPLAVTLQQTVGSCANPCNLVFVATEQNLLYAFNAALSSPAPVWSLNLGSPVDCGALPPGTDYDPCSSGLLGQYVGVTGTPVIDPINTHPTLYVAAAIQSSTTISFYLFAVDITTGLVRGTPIQIAGMVAGESPDPDGKHLNGDCTSDFPGNGSQVAFEYHHIQRAALLLLPNGTVYVAFSGGRGDVNGETTNGWMFGYQFNFTTNTFSPTAVFNSTPYGTGGGIWGSGSGPASDGTYIYAATANGTIFDPLSPTIPYDLGDSLVKLDPSNNLNVVDYYAPPDAGKPRCLADRDFGSGGVLLPPLHTFTYNSMNVVFNADKDSNIYVANQGSLGKFNASSNCTNSFNNIQCITSPPIPPNDLAQGYWASPAYWQYSLNSTNYYMLYYSVTTQTTSVKPKTLNGYQLQTTGTSGPITSTTPTVSTTTLFCYPSPTPSVSSNGTTGGTGIVWAIEKQNVGNPTNCSGTTFPPAALHAFNATTLAPLYTSSGVQTTIGPATSFSTPTVFNGYVYMGTKTEVDVFGLCPSNGPSGCKQ